MTVPPEQAEVVAFLRGLAGTEPLETHISLVFVGADTVWKLKKAVRLAFLDFTSLKARQRFTLRELELNRPAAPGLYRDVVPVVRCVDGTLGFGETGEHPVVDWVLRMAPVPAGDFLDAVAASGRLTAELLDALGDAVAAFHRGLTPATGTDAVATMRNVANGNAQSARDAPQSPRDAPLPPRATPSRRAGCHSRIPWQRSARRAAPKVTAHSASFCRASPRAALSRAPRRQRPPRFLPRS